jgi:hypothetical protein
MSCAKKSDAVRGARSVLAEDQASFVDEHGRRGKYFSGGRKVACLEHVGARTPDADPDVALNPRRRAHTER